MSDSKNSWSEVLLVVGAGATAVLGMPQTDAQSKFFRALASVGEDFEGNKWRNYTLEEALSKKGPWDIFGKTPGFSGRNLEIMVAFLELLGNNLEHNWNVVYPEDYVNAKVIFGNHDHKLLEARIRELRAEYDWNALKQIVSICPNNLSNDNLIRDLFTIVDQKMAQRQGIMTPRGFIAYNRMNGVRNCAILLINILFASTWYKISKERGNDIFKRYESFAATLAKMMQKEGLDFQSKKLNSRNYYLFTYSVLNFNFETVFELLLMYAHRDINHTNVYLSSSQMQKIWLDFGVEQRFRNVEDDGKCGLGLSVDETVCLRTNECKSVGVDINRVGKFFFAHGCSNWRECPACGCKSVYGAGEWNLFSEHHNPPLPIPLFETTDFKRTEREKKWKDLLRLDSLECPSCGGETFASASPMIMQTMVKGVPTSFLEEIQRSTKVSLKKARHIILFGYRLPPDDIVWQEAFAEAVRCRENDNDKPFCSVVVGYKGEKKWMYDDELIKYVHAHLGSDDCSAYGADAIENAVSIFGEKYVRAYCGGIPDVWGNATENEVSEILYPKWVNWSGTRLEKD